MNLWTNDQWRRLNDKALKKTPTFERILKVFVNEKKKEYS